MHDNFALGGSAPAARAPPFAIVLCYLFWGYRNAPRPPRGTGDARGAIMPKGVVVTTFGGGLLIITIYYTLPLKQILKHYILHQGGKGT